MEINSVIEALLRRKHEMKTTMKTKQQASLTGWNYFSLALTAFGGLGMELLYAFLLEPHLYGAPISGWTGRQIILHWLLTCTTWGFWSCLLIHTAKKKYSLNLLSPGKRLKLYQYTLALLFTAIAIALHCYDWKGLKIVREFQNKGLLLFSFQYLYYAFETVLFMLIIVFGQKACELWLDECFSARLRGKIPYGGIICGLTWGLAHTFTKGSLTAGLSGILWGFMMGSAYLVVNKDIRKAWIVMFLMFAF
ncbi:MAG: hypothetical protein NC337_02830 [Roseburia sp.]|nr:hypothetical protein [Roseburia sp.]